VRSDDEKVVYRPVRRKLPDERQSITHKFSIGGHEGYITVGMYEDGTPGEIFITMAKEGSTISGLMDSFATSISYCLQYGVPLKFLVDKFGHVRFEPSGWTGNPQIPYAKSIPDYIFRWLGAKFLGAEYATNEAGAAGDASDRAESAGIAAVSGGGLRCADVRRMRRHDDAQRQLL
jgi:ribonucleoside-diphosphate reductase alpha chain